MKPCVELLEYSIEFYIKTCVHVFSVFVRALNFQSVVLYLKEYLDHYIGDEVS